MNHQLYVRYIKLKKTKVTLSNLIKQLENQLKPNEQLIRWAIVDSEEELIIEAGIKAID